jgi:multiple sugar transport system ATP-binding protein
MARVELRNVKKVFPPDVVAVAEASLEVKDKEFLVLVGPSGCGKSTTLRMIAGLEEATEGEIYIADQLVNDVPPKNRDIAMVFQNYALYPHMTVYKNMAFGLMLRKYKKADIKARVQEAARILNIEHLLDRKPKALSGGERQRVAVGRAIVRKPKVFLFDEPLSNLDAKLRVQMRTEISKLHHRLEATMIYVTHDQTEAMTMGDRIVVLKDGHIQQIDDPLALYGQPKNKFVAGFIGSPPMNFMDGTLTRKDGDICFDEGSFLVRVSRDQKAMLEPYVGKKVFFGIRPEDIRDCSSPEECPPDTTVRASIEVVEPLGNEIILYMATKFNTFVARVATEQAPHVDEVRLMGLDMEKAHFFDVETEKNITETD